MQYHGLRERESTAALRNSHSIFAAVTATKTGKTGQQQMIATETQKAQRTPFLLFNGATTAVISVVATFNL